MELNFSYLFKDRFGYYTGFGRLIVVSKDSIRACGLCGCVFSITATDYDSRCPNCKSRVQNSIEDL